MRWTALAIAVAVHLAVLAVAVPASPWEFDEPLFLQGVRTYAPQLHHPPPPGYPLFMFAGQVAGLLAPSHFAALIALSFVASLAGFVMLALAFEDMAGDETTGLVAASLFYFSPAMLIHSTLPISEPGAFALLAAALLAARKGKPDLFGVAAALAVGWRLQFAVLIVPLLLAEVALMRRMRERLIALAAFTLVCLAWLHPLQAALGGIQELIDYELAQGRYLAQHDADVSRSGWSWPRLLFRFMGRAWGTPLSAALVAGLAAWGIWLIARARQRGFLPLGLAAGGYLAFALWTMDPTDGVRYALPFVLATAYAAAVGLVTLTRRLQIGVYVPLALAAMASFWYVSSILMQRRAGPSPPVSAAQYARQAFPANSVVLYELPLWPHATYFLADREPMRVDRGLETYVDRPEVPLFIYADGNSDAPGARVFRWRHSDAYRKLTRNHYRVVSVIPLPPERRFAVLEGIYQFEREPDGDAWRWMSQQAALKLPARDAQSVRVTLGLAPDSVIEENRVEVSIGDQKAVFPVTRGRRTQRVIPIPPGEKVVRFAAEKSVVPAEVPGSLNRDPRRLAVKLYDLVTE